MSDIFSMSDAQNLLHKKHVVFIGDSNVRAVYKDLTCLLNKNMLIEGAALKRKLEKSHMGDSLKKGELLHRGRDYVEVREYKTNNHLLEFSFATKCYNSTAESLVTAVKKDAQCAPDVIIMNSCVWDITRWGPSGVSQYKENMQKLMASFQQVLPKRTMVIWMTTLPISSSITGGFLVKQVEFLKHTLRFEVMEANMLAREVVVSHGFDVLDLHHHLRMQIQWRAKDGIHWEPKAMRHVTNLLLTHIALSWGRPLPDNFSGRLLEREKELAMMGPVTEPLKPSKLQASSFALSPAVKRGKKAAARARKQYRNIAGPSNRRAVPYSFGQSESGMTLNFHFSQPQAENEQVFHFTGGDANRGYVQMMNIYGEPVLAFRTDADTYIEQRQIPYSLNSYLGPMWF